MLNDSLIDQLTLDLKPVRRRSAAGDGLVIGGICLVELALFLLMGAMRPDMQAAMHHPSLWWKLVSLGLIAAVSGMTAVVSFHPAGSPRRGVQLTLAIVSICLAVGWGLNSARAGWSSVDARLDWRHGVECLYKMVLLALPVFMGLAILMQRAAPTDRQGTAWSIGIASAAWGAFVFVFTCPFDDPLYIAFWYTATCSLIAVCGRLLLPILSRW
ncbi:NrsF family protein [Lichenicola sp.]|uniref:NrsF family protein n=1 Tax=Lichenicola sp. TaxID=2804529 RepID=UPI003AFFF087